MPELSDDSRRIFAKLSAILALQKAQIEANPIPHLNRAAKAYDIMYRAIEEAIIVMHGADDLDLWVDEGKPEPGPPIREMCLSRNSKATKILEKAMRDLDNEIYGAR